MNISALCSIRFGYGIAGDRPAVLSPEDLLDDLTGQDTMAMEFAGETTQDRIATIGLFRDARKRDRNNRDSPAVKVFRQTLQEARMADLKRAILRPLVAPVGFRERLVAFWADHFAIAARGLPLGALIGPYRDDAIRPHVSGRFSDLLFAAVTHPAMLNYLDQQSSVGPNAPAAREGQGLNENLAREILELHTLGVGAGYSQSDVTEFAKLLTGLRVNRDGAGYFARFAEPGAETVLGVEYSGGERLGTIREALDDIAQRPETAAHLARKLAVHFVSDEPDPGLVASLEATYLASGGRLMPVYEALLAHEAAWALPLSKVKPPMDYGISAGRALGLPPQQIEALGRREMLSEIVTPMTGMGQRPFTPNGPDGWPERAEDWITPATLATRVRWVSALAEDLAGSRDPRAMLDVVLPKLASRQLRFAVAGSESGWEGVALILASPEFNRR